MAVLMKASAGVLVALVLGLVLSKQGKDMTLLLTLAACCMVAAAAFTYLEPVFTFFEKLQSLGNLNTDIIAILTKSVGIGLLAEIVCMICADAGNAALGKVLQLLATAAILWLSIPLLEQLLELLESILGNI